MKFSPLPSSRGITLIELIIVIAIIGVLSSFGTPVFSGLLAKKSVAAETRRVISALKLARSEARTRGSTVTLARDSGEDWSGPIDVYVDVTAANNPRNGNDDLVRRQEASSRTVVAVDNQDANDEWISFNTKGWLAESGPVWIAICAPAIDTSQGMYININRVGKIRASQIDNDPRGCNP